MTSSRRLALGAVAAFALFSTGCLTVPMAADRADSSRFIDEPRHSGVRVDVIPLQAGRALAPRCAAAGEASCLGSTEIVYGAYLVRHPKGTFLIDAGLSSHAWRDLDRFGPLQRTALEYEDRGSLKESLEALGSPHIDFVLLTHAHWDHTSGLADLPNPRVVLGPGEAEFVKHFPKDVPPTVMPDHFAGTRMESFKWDGPPYENFPASHDWYGDGSVVLVPLPGHTPGSIGIFINRAKGRRLLFIGDAGWSIDAVEIPSHKLKPLSKFTDADPTALAEALWRLHHLRERDPALLIVPAHDGAAMREVERSVPLR